MLLLHNTIVLALLLGGGVGLVVGLSGAGGGVIAVPLLVFGLNLPVRNAAPVGLIAVGIAAGVGAALGLRQGIVRYRAAALIGICGIATAPAGLWLARRIPNQPLMIVFSLILAWVGIQTLRRTLSPKTRDMELCATAPCRTALSSGRFIWDLPCARMLSLTGLLSGLLSGLLGVGGGFVIVPALTRYTNLNAQSVIATSLGVIALVSGGSVAAAAVGGSIDLKHIHGTAIIDLAAVLANTAGRADVAEASLDLGPAHRPAAAVPVAARAVLVAWGARLDLG